MELHPQKQKDIAYGFNNEKDCLPIINKFFNVNMISTKYKYDTFDFIEKDKIIVELKSRRCNKHDYRKRGGIMIGANKVKKGLKYIKKGYKVYFCWLFFNKLCYYELTPNFIKDITLKKDVMARNDRGMTEYSDIAYIPTKKLKNICLVKKVKDNCLFE